MNDEHTPLDLAEQRLARDLRSAANHMPLAPGSEVAVVATGRRRRHRRRQANAIMLVAATGIGTAFTIRQLARNGDSSIATDTVPSTDDTGSVPRSAVPAPTTPADSTAAPATTEPLFPVDTAPIDDGSDEPAPAQIVESNMVWNVIEPDSTQAVAYGDLSAMTTASGLPGVMLSTAPGRSEDYVPQLWRTEDGVTWTPVEIDVPFGSLHNTRFTADGVYVVGTAPGIAADRPNPLLLGVSHDDGANWDQIELPVDTNAGHDLPFITEVGASAVVYPIDGGAVVWLYTGAQLDYDAIAAQSDIELWPDFGVAASVEGVYVPVDPTCQPSDGVVSTVPVFGAAATVPYPPVIADCETRLVGWDEIGVPQETIDLAFNRTPREFRVIGDEVTELDVPVGVAGVWATTARGPLFTSEDGRSWFRMGSDGVVVETNAPTGDGYPIGTNGDSEFVQTSLNRGMFGSYDTAVGASTAGGPWVYTDWSNLPGGGRLAFPMATGVTSAGMIEVLQVVPDAIAAEGGVSVTIDGYTISRETGRSPISIVDPEGQAVDLTHVWYAEGGVIITDDDGNRLATLDGPTFQSVLEDASAGAGPEDFLVAVSADGAHVSVESIPELLGGDVSDISSIPRISAVGNTTVIAVTLKERNAEGLPRQLVLVGTPRT